MHTYMKPRELASALGVHEDTIINWIHRGVITHYRTNGMSGGGVRYYIDATAEFGITKEVEHA